jgi:hypothetical protein
MYTSAPQGLKAGSRGFCTVVSTQGMAVNLSERLESLSGYRHVFPPNDPQVALNPVVYSHLKLIIGGRRCHVLSRICAAGLDYTQRTNKFAHHVVLDDNELSPAGPAWLLQQPGFMATAWDGQTLVLPGGRRPPMGQLQPAICQAWAQATGDAGWGGVLAETAANGSRGGGATVVFRPGMDVLALVAEAIALLPPEHRWDVTFSTYFTKLPPGVDCLWRFVVAGSPEAAARFPGVTAIDLTRSLSRAPDGVWATAARTGSAPRTERPVVPTSGSVPHSAKLDDDAELQRLLAEEQLSARASSGAAQQTAPVVEILSGSSRPPLPGVASPIDSPRKFRSKAPSRLLWFLASAAVLLVLVAGGIAAFMATNGISDQVAANDVDKPGAQDQQRVRVPSGSEIKEKSQGTVSTTIDTKPPAEQGASAGSDEVPASDTKDEVAEDSRSKDDGQARDGQRGPNPKEETEHDGKAPPEEDSTPPGSAAAAGQIPPAEAPPEPTFEAAEVPDAVRESEQGALSPLAGKDLEMGPFVLYERSDEGPVTIEILGGGMEVLDGERTIAVHDGIAQLEVSKTAPVERVRHDRPDPLEIGTLSFDGRRLTFEWAIQKPDGSDLLQSCLLHVAEYSSDHSDGMKLGDAFFALRTPATPQIKWSGSAVDAKAAVEVDLPPNALLRVHDLRFHALINGYSLINGLVVTEKARPEETLNNGQRIRWVDFAVKHPELDCPSVNIAMLATPVRTTGRQSSMSTRCQIQLKVSAVLGDAISDSENIENIVRDITAYIERGKTKQTDTQTKLTFIKEQIDGTSDKDTKQQLRKDQGELKKSKTDIDRAVSRREAFGQLMQAIGFFSAKSFRVSIDVDDKHGIEVIRISSQPFAVPTH